jgi:hypothetical protein
MTSIRFRALAFLVLGFCACFGIAPASAHGTETRVLPSGAIAVEFRYTDGRPMVFADAVAFAPGRPSEPAATGRTDLRGRFSLYPDVDGEWSIEVRDAGGHFARTTIVASGEHAMPPRHAIPDWLVAISLVCNVLLAALLGHRRRPARPPPTTSDREIKP